MMMMMMILKINLQQDICYISHRTLSMPLHYLAKLLLRMCSTFSKLLMMFIGVSKFRKTNLIFVGPRVQINGTYFRDVLLTKPLLPVMREISGEFFILQQDSAPAHRASETINLVEWETPAFISPDLRSPDLNPVDYRIWG